MRPAFLAQSSPTTVGKGWQAMDEESESVLSGAGEMLSSAWDATENVAEAALDTVMNVGEYSAAGFVGLAAIGADAIGETGAAASLNATGQGMVDDVLHREYEAQEDLAQAWDDVVGASEEPAEPEPTPVFLVPDE